MKKAIFLFTIAAIIGLVACEKEIIRQDQQTSNGTGDAALVKKVEAWLGQQTLSDVGGSYKIHNALTVYQDHPIQFFQRLQAINLGLIDLANNPNFRQLIMNKCQEKACEDEHEVTGASLISQYNAMNGNLLNEMSQSVVNHGGSGQQVQFAVNNFASMQIAGIVFEPVIVVPYMEHEMVNLADLNQWDGITPEFITTTSSFLNTTEMLAYKLDGTPFVADVAYLSTHAGWFVSLKYTHGDGSVLPLKPIIVEKCHPVGEPQIGCCSATNTGTACQILIFNGFISIGPGDKMCCPISPQ